MTTARDGVNWIKIGDAELGGTYITATAGKITPEGAQRSRKVVAGDLILSNSMSFGRPYIMAIDGYIHDGWLRLREDASRIGKHYFYYALGSDDVLAQFKRAATGGVVNNLNSGLVGAVTIPLPPIQAQEEIVADLEAERVLVDANRELIERMEKRIEAAIARVWGAAELVDPPEALAAE